ncbi:hypothetical protein M0D21_01515 [Aquimarina sp. D1M17]|uniref:hypothetical protein n=1 Tax=Aquimarina acroporae TaxID=2937283 RepID=UPI0020BFE0FD|nr:hypothetical protein [Aquimarina acroporae]MCK8520222.1 hypothetical protein [Aquimarina acroporae]
MKQPKETLKSYFETGDKPTEQEFCDLIDSYHHQDSGAVVTNVSVNDNGDQQITFSDGTTVSIDSPSVINQNNKIKVVDLGVLRFGGGVGVEAISRLERADAINIEKDIALPVRGNLQRISFVETLLVTAINNLNPPLIIKEDENVIFEFDIESDIVFPGPILGDVSQSAQA